MTFFILRPLEKDTDDTAVADLGAVAEAKWLPLGKGDGAADMRD